MTRAELRAEIFRRLNEESANPSFWTADDINTAISDGYEEMSDASEWYERECPVPVLSELTYYDLQYILGGEIALSIKAIYGNAMRRWLTSTNQRELDRHTYAQWERTTGEPANMFRCGLRWLGLFPKKNADNGTITVFYTAMPPALARDTDRPGFPEEFHIGIIEYAMGDLLSQEMETRKALSHFQEYMAHEEKLSKFVKSRIGKDRMYQLRG